MRVTGFLCSARPSGAGGAGHTPFYRLYSPTSGDHFYTANWAEAVNAFTNLGYKYEGIAAYVSTSSTTGLRPFYRLYSPGSGDHFYTITWAEAVNAFNN